MFMTVRSLSMQAQHSNHHDDDNDNDNNNNNDDDDNVNRHGHNLKHSTNEPLAAVPSFSMGLRSLPNRFLREMDDSNFDPSTFQRTDVAFDAKTGKPLLDATYYGVSSSPKYTIKSRVWEADTQVIEWADGVVSRFSREWIDSVLQQSTDSTMAQPSLWTGLTEAAVRASPTLTMDFDQVLHDSSAALRTLFEYGILLIPHTPVDDHGAGVGALAASLSGGTVKQNTTSLLQNYRDNVGSGGQADHILENGTDGPMRTLYGSVWYTSSGAQQDGTSVADSAYSNGSLPLHTDMTYYRDPPGLQVFTMQQVADRGGESVYADGFAAASILQQEYPEAFETLSTVERTYRCVDPELGWHLEAKGPVIRTNEHGQIIGIRHNDLDRMPDLPPLNDKHMDIHHYYQRLAYAHQVWDATLARDDVRLVLKLQPGDTLIVANQRCLHARHSFETSPDRPRAVMGCYVR